MSVMLQRRAVLTAGLAAFSLATLGGGSAFAQAARLRLLWWGSQERADRTNKALAAYKQVKPDIDIAGEFAGWSDYWPRLATQVAGRNAPDLIQMDYRYIFEYARRGALAPLDEYLGKSLKIDDFGAPNIDSGRVDGKLYGIWHWCGCLWHRRSAPPVFPVLWQRVGQHLCSPLPPWGE